MKTRTKLLFAGLPVVLAATAGGLLLSALPRGGPDRIEVADGVVGVRAGISYRWLAAAR